MEQIQKQKNHERYAPDEELVETVGQVAVDSTIDLLEEIDQILEEVGHDMAVNYQQRGGE